MMLTVIGRNMIVVNRMKKNAVLLAVVVMSLCLGVEMVMASSDPDDKGEKLVIFNKLVSNTWDFHNRLELKNFPNEKRSNWIDVIAGNDEDKQIKIATQALEVRAIADESILGLMDDYYDHKGKYGSEIEKEVYGQLNTKESIFKRLITDRPYVFTGEQDNHLLRNNKQNKGSFIDVGTLEEKKITLKEYISYDEMPISALLGVSAPTMFINNGGRFNKAQSVDVDPYEEEGIYTGLVGPRFEKPDCWDWKHIIITSEQNTAENGYGSENLDDSNILSLWSKFYETTFPTFKQAVNDKSGKYVKVQNSKKKIDGYFNIEVYKKRMRLVIEPFLVDANEQGKKNNKKVYCHAVGLGLGYWAVNDNLQAEHMLEVYAEIIRDRDLSWISDIDFSWFPEKISQECGGIKNLEKFKMNNNDIIIHFSKRNPADRLEGVDKGKLLVAMYAWDSNSFVGNEYLKKAFTASGDPAAACCSTIFTSQNPEINTYFKDSIYKNLFIVKSSLYEKINFIINGNEKVTNQVELLEALFKTLVNQNQREMSQKDLAIQELKDDVSKKDESIKELEGNILKKCADIEGLNNNISKKDESIKALENNLMLLSKQSENQLKAAGTVYEEKEEIYKKSNEYIAEKAAAQITTLKDEYWKSFSTCALAMGMNINGMTKKDFFEKEANIIMRNSLAEGLQGQLKVAQNQLKMGKIVVGSALIMAILAYLLKNYTDILTVPVSETSYVGA